MGTRNLTMVVKGGKFKIAQYGQWDGYPSGNGVVILDFVKTADLNEFSKKLDNVRWINDDEIKKVEATENWPDVYPELSRDTGARILQMVLDGKATVLVDSHGFAGDSLFCEWAYLIDMDTNTLEVYKGFTKSPVTKGRFKTGDDDLEKDFGGVYHPIELFKTYSISELPTEEQFLKDLEYE